MLDLRKCGSFFVCRCFVHWKYMDYAYNLEMWAFLCTLPMILLDGVHVVSCMRKSYALYMGYLRMECMRFLHEKFLCTPYEILRDGVYAIFTWKNFCALYLRYLRIECMRFLHEKIFVHSIWDFEGWSVCDFLPEKIFMHSMWEYHK